MIKVKYQTVQRGVVERENELEYLPDAHMADIIRFLKDSIPKVRFVKLQLP
jgi:hypothetical protein